MFLTLLALFLNLKPSSILANTYYVLGAELRTKITIPLGQQEEATYLSRQNSRAQQSPIPNPLRFLHLSDSRVICERVSGGRWSMTLTSTKDHQLNSKGWG